MAVDSNIVLTRQEAIGIITIDYPPVNALSQSVRQGLISGIQAFEKDPLVKAIVIRCSGKTFIAGADIKEFAKPATEPLLPEVVNSIEACSKPVVASLFGTSLGGGFEVALACHYRVALASAKIGLPEVNLGLIPGAGGTQRLPRIVGSERAMTMITSGQHYSVSEFANTSLFDCVFDDEQNLDQATLNFVSDLLEKNQIKVRAVGEKAINDDGFDWDQALTKVAQKARGKEAPIVAAQVLFETRKMPIKQGMDYERTAFLKLRESSQSAALRFAFNAEKNSAKISNSVQPIDVNKIGIVGGGNMGSGIATAFLMAGFEVVLIEQNQAGLNAGVERINANFKANFQRGRMSQSELDACLAKLITNTDYQALADCELVLEAVFEDLQIKKELFQKLDQICSKDCLFATNTSYLDINQIANSIEQPERMIGMHFFSPAHIMKLLEVVRAEKSSELAIATAMAVGKKLKKISVVVGVCFGFAGNRMYTRYGREIQQMLLEGAEIEQIDRAMTNWGMAMGPMAVQDLSGIDIGHNARSAQPFPKYDPGYFRASAAMVENGRLGRKTSKGFYDYDDKGKPMPSEEAQQLILSVANKLSIQRRSFSDEEITERALLALICEGIDLFNQGIVQKWSDIDLIWLHGYGFPRYKGGPMFQGQQMGIEKVSALLDKYRSQYGDQIWPIVDVNSLAN